MLLCAYCYTGNASNYWSSDILLRDGKILGQKIRFRSEHRDGNWQYENDGPLNQDMNVISGSFKQVVGDDNFRTFIATKVPT